MCPPESPDEVYSRTAETGERQSVAPGELLELLGDEYTRRVLQTVTGQSRTGREIIEMTSVSKPTVYRRLDRLQEAGLVESETEVDADGHHRKQFTAVVERFDVEFTGDGLVGHVETTSESTQSSGDRPAEASLTADD